jgi:holo-[acyl-carrier protein] synthase
MIIGIGTDIVDIRRIEKLIADSGEKFISKIFNDEERGEGAAHYAKRFAAKEAIAKALGTGIGKVSFKDIVITNDENGAPKAEVRNQGSGVRVHISLSDEYPYALAYSVVEATSSI